MMFIYCLMFLAWGSYLNSLGYRLLHLATFFKVRSFCPSCSIMIRWYDNIPVISWLALQGQCRHCQLPISWLYLFIEIITPLLLASLWYAVPGIYFPAYFLFFSALIVTIRTDFDEMLISRFMTLYLVPVGVLAAANGHIPLSLIDSILGICCGYGLLWSTQKIARWITKKESLGQGDLELLAFIGAFTGPFGCWIAMTIGSILGTVISLIIMAIRRQQIILIPLGAYLSCGALFFVLQEQLLRSYFVMFS